MLEFKLMEGSDFSNTYAAYFNSEMLPLQSGLTIKSNVGDFTEVEVVFIVPKDHKDIVIRSSHGA